MPKPAYNVRNTYYVMRHGQSTANVQGIVLSWPEHGVRPGYGLTAHGRQQVEQAAQVSGLPASTLVYSSDFARAYQTAMITQHTIGAEAVTVASELRERYFGELEFAEAKTAYQDVWRADTSGQAYGHGVEPLSQVAARVMRLVQSIEQHYTGKTVLLVSHGDTLQALQVAWQGHDPARDYYTAVPLANAQIVKLPSVCQAPLP